MLDQASRVQPATAPPYTFREAWRHDHIGSSWPWPASRRKTRSSSCKRRMPSSSLAEKHADPEGVEVLTAGSRPVRLEADLQFGRPYERDGRDPGARPARFRRSEARGARGAQPRRIDILLRRGASPSLRTTSARQMITDCERGLTRLRLPRAHGPAEPAEAARPPPARQPARSASRGLPIPSDKGSAFASCRASRRNATAMAGR